MTEPTKRDFVENDIPYMQDFRFMRGIPSKVTFEVEEGAQGKLRLRAPGYGASPYGNGAIFVLRKDIEEFDVKLAASAQSADLEAWAEDRERRIYSGEVILPDSAEPQEAEAWDPLETLAAAVKVLWDDVRMIVTKDSACSRWHEDAILALAAIRARLAMKRHLAAPAQSVEPQEAEEQRHEIRFIDATPDEGYIRRILEAYIDDSYYSDNTAGLPPENEVCKMMNKWREERNALLRAVLARLASKPSREEEMREQIERIKHDCENALRSSKHHKCDYLSLIQSINDRLERAALADEAGGKP